MVRKFSADNAEPGAARSGIRVSNRRSIRTDRDSNEDAFEHEQDHRIGANWLEGSSERVRIDRVSLRAHSGQPNFSWCDSYPQHIAFQETGFCQPTPGHPNKWHAGLGREATLICPADLDCQRLSLRQRLLEEFRSKNSSFHPDIYPSKATRPEDLVPATVQFLRYARPRIVVHAPFEPAPPE